MYYHNKSLPLKKITACIGGGLFILVGVFFSYLLRDKIKFVFTKTITVKESLKLPDLIFNGHIAILCVLLVAMTSVVFLILLLTKSGEIK